MSFVAVHGKVMEIEDFLATFIVRIRHRTGQELVLTLNMSSKSQIYKESTKKRKRPGRRQAIRYEDFNWEELVLTGELKSLYVFEFDTGSLPYGKKS
jgi:hypothetical protein